jgi:hypothetical protein
MRRLDCDKTLPRKTLHGVKRWLNVLREPPLKVSGKCCTPPTSVNDSRI